MFVHRAFWSHGLFRHSLTSKKINQITDIITPILKSLVVPVIWLAIIGASYSRIAPFFCFKSHLFPNQWARHTKNKTTNQISRLAWATNLIAGEWKTKSIIWQILQLLLPKLFFFPKKWMNSISSRLTAALIKYLNLPSPVFGQFRNGCNKVVIEPRVVQFWSEIILVKSRVWFQPKLLSTQINHHYISTHI